MNTADAILETALTLFNRNGASSVSTRHIADEMRISPGNLYYHFRNREEIVRALMQRMIDEFSGMFIVENTDADPLSAVKQFVNTGEGDVQVQVFYMEPVICWRDA